MALIKHYPKIGLALSGGGARGLAHIGVMKTLQNAGIPIDFMSGASMGAIIAGLYCAGVSIERLELEALSFSKPHHLIKLIDFSPPRRGLIRGEKVKDLLFDILDKDYQIDQLKIPLAITAVNLKNSQEVCLNSGSLIDAMLASSAVPGLFDPIIIENQTLVDGSVLNNLPVDLVRKMGAELVIAVDVNFFYENQASWEEPFVASRLNSFLPAIFKDIYQAEMIMVSALTENKLKQHKPDFLIRPKIPFDVNIFMGFNYADKIITAGEEMAQSFITQIIEQVNSYKN